MFSKTRFEITVILNAGMPNSPLLLGIHKLDSRKALIIVGNGLTFLEGYIVFDSYGQLFRSKDFLVLGLISTFHHKSPLH